MDNFKICTHKLLLEWSNRHVARRAGTQTSYRIFIRQPEGKRPLGKPRRWWEDDIEINLKDIVCGLDSSGSS